MRAVRIAFSVFAVALLAMALVSCGRMKKISGIVGTWNGTPRVMAAGVPMHQNLVLKISKEETFTLDMDSDSLKGSWTLEESTLTLRVQSPKAGVTVPDMKLKLAPDLYTLRYDGTTPNGGAFSYVFLKQKKGSK